MQQILKFRLLPRDAADESQIRQLVAESTGADPLDITGFYFLKRSIDARGKIPRINLTLKAFIREPYQERERLKVLFQDVQKAKKNVIIIGAGPAGLFAALYFLEHGIKPVILERGKDVRARRRDLASLNKEGLVNLDSNYCFGEGGAGTYSDGKLYTRSSKRGDLDRILNILVNFGAPESILYDSHPHIGTNKLPGIITSMRKRILDCGGEFLFEKKLTDILIEGNKIISIKTDKGEQFKGDAVILATGHSARDIFQLLYAKRLAIQFKPFALGVRVEHPQELIDQLQYHLSANQAYKNYLPPASYSWVQQTPARSVFSFCMCPGGIIAPASTSAGEIVINGWSPSKRNNPFANSGIVVPVEEKDVSEFQKQGELAGMFFQQAVEQAAFKAGGGNLVAPAQRLVDFVQNKFSATLPTCSYLPGTNSFNLRQVLPVFIYEALSAGFKQAGIKMNGYLTNEAIVLATESRTSSPVRIPRHEQLLHHPQLINFYPCGEGAGYAGGIVSAAMDGERIARQVTMVLKG